MAHGLSCSVACGIFPDQGPNPCPLHWQVDSQPLCHQRCPYISDFIYLNLIYFISLAKALPILIKKKKKNFKKINLFILAAVGFCCCMQAFSSSGDWGLLFVVVHGLLIVVASFVVEYGL